MKAPEKGKVFDAGPPQVGAGSLSFCRFSFCCRFPWVADRPVYPSGPILGSVFLWRCFSRQTFLNPRGSLSRKAKKVWAVLQE